MPTGMTTEARRALTDWVTARLGASIKPMWADQDAPAPGATYITLRVMTNTSVGEDYVGAPDSEGVLEVIGNREYMLYLQAFGPGALDALDTLRNSLQLESVGDAFITAGIAFIDAQRVENLSQLIGQNMNERGALDVRFRANSSVTDTVGLIEDADIEGLIDVEALILEVNETDLLVNGDQLEIVAGAGFVVNINVDT